MLEKYNDVLCVDEICEVLNVGKNTAYQLLQTNQIKHKRVGRIYKIPKMCVIEYLESA